MSLQEGKLINSNVPQWQPIASAQQTVKPLKICIMKPSHISYSVVYHNMINLQQMYEIGYTNMLPCKFSKAFWILLVNAKIKFYNVNKPVLLYYEYMYIQLLYFCGWNGEKLTIRLKKVATIWRANIQGCPAPFVHKIYVNITVFQYHRQTVL